MALKQPYSAKGKPANPPKLKLCPYMATKSSSNSRANSSQQKLVAREVLFDVKLCFCESVLWSKDTRVELVMAPGKECLTILSKVELLLMRDDGVGVDDADGNCVLLAVGR